MQNHVNKSKKPGQKDLPVRLHSGQSSPVNPPPKKDESAGVVPLDGQNPMISNAARTIRNKTGKPGNFQELALNLSQLTEGFASEDLVQQMLITITKLVEMEADRLDFKILNTTLKELRYAFKIFSPYRKFRKVSIFGSARTDEKDPDYAMAFKLGEALAKNDFMVITGAGDGIMKAAQGGAGAEKGFGVNIMLPFEQNANLFIEKDPKLVTFKYFFTRKLIFIKETNGIVLFPGGFGTHDEGFETLTLLQTGKCDPLPVVFVDNPTRPYWAKWKEFLETCLLSRNLISSDDFHLFKITTSAEEAVEEIIQFYKNYHSIQYVREKLVMRLAHPVDDSLLNRLNREFKDILVNGRFEKTRPLPEESAYPDLEHLERIIFSFDKRRFGRLRQLINFLNHY